jgi:hypothetical protein
MQRKTLLALVIAAAIVSASLYLLLQPRAPSQAPAQTAVNATRPQPPPETPKPKPPTIIATIETSNGGTVLVNGTYTYTWSSSTPFTLLLKAVPDTCYAFDHWEVNGEEHSGPDLALAIAGNTTVRAVFYKPLYTVTINTNATGAAAQINGENHTLPTSLRVPACSTVEVKPLAMKLFEPINGTMTLQVMNKDVTVNLFFKLRSKYKLPLYSNLQVYVNGTLQPALAFESPFLLNKGTAEMQDGWIHLNGTHLLYIYIPLNYTVVVESRGVVGTLYVDRFCNETFAYAVTLDSRRPSVTFTGCKPSWYKATITSTRIFDFNIPGILRISLANAPGAPAEAWVKIEAYP